MTYEQWTDIYSEMIRLANEDKTLTHIDLTFQIREIDLEPKRARIKIKVNETKKNTRR